MSHFTKISFINAISVPKYKTFFTKTRELRKLIMILIFFVIAIAFTIRSLGERVGLYFQHIIYC